MEALTSDSGMPLLVSKKPEGESPSVEVEPRNFTLYVPDSCVQGSLVPFHLLWDPDEEVNGVAIHFPKELRLKELHNTEPSRISIQGSTVRIKGFEVNGYVGGLFESSLLAQPLATPTVVFDVSWNGLSLTRELRITLFRCEVSILNCPKRIHVSLSKQLKPVADSKIVVSNRGNGTGLVKLSVAEKSELKDILPAGFEEFKAAVARDLKKGLHKVEEEFPSKRRVVQEYLRLWDDPLPKDKKTLRQLQSLQTRMQRAFESDESFLREFAGSFVRAIIKNLKLTTDIDAFLAYIESIGKRKLILIDAIKVFEVSKTPKRLEAELTITDLSYNRYKPLSLPSIEISADKKCRIPIFELLESGNPGE